MDDKKTKFTFSQVFRMEDSFGAHRDYADTLWFDDLPGARRAHTTACQGGWVKPKWLSPHVSALKVWKAGRLLPEDLAPKADWCDGCAMWRCPCGSDRKVAA